MTNWHRQAFANQRQLVLLFYYVMSQYLNNHLIFCPYCGLGRDAHLVTVHPAETDRSMGNDSGADRIGFARRNSHEYSLVEY
jgi:hypothetical protein